MTLRAVKALAGLDPATWATGLSAPMARATWATALDGFGAPRTGVELRDATVLLVGSANVYTALLPWVVLLAGAGARVLVKPARGQERAVAAMVAAVAAAGGSAELRAWKGGVDVDTERAALDQADAVIAFGGDAAIDAIRARSARPVLGFGPRFGVAMARGDDAGAVAKDVALYDTRGCMSPAGVFVDDVDLDRFAAALDEAERRWPVGDISAAEASATRTRVLLTRARGGQVRQGAGWTLLYSEQFSPLALPRVLALHPRSALEQLAPHAHLLGTVAGPHSLPALRTCAVGEMQTPMHDGVHEGVDVLDWVRRATSPGPLSR